MRLPVFTSIGLLVLLSTSALVVRSAAAADGSWRSAGSTAVPYANHRATLLANGDALVAGYLFQSGGKSIYSAELFSLTAGRFSATGPVPEWQEARQLVGLSDGRALVISFTRAYLFDPRSNTWTETGELSHGRLYPRAELLRDGRVIVVGGLEDVTSEIWNPATGQFSKGPDLAVARTDPITTALADGRVFVLGGNYKDHRIELFDPVTNQFTLGGSFFTSVGGAGEDATLLNDGRVFISDASYPALFDPASGGFSRLPDGCEAPLWSSATLLADGRVLVAGGIPVGPGSTPTTTTLLFDPRFDACASAPSMALGRYDHTATRLPDGSVLVVGGYTQWTNKDATDAAERFAAGPLPDTAPPAPSPGPGAASGPAYRGTAPRPGGAGLLITGRTIAPDDLVSTLASSGCRVEILGILERGSWFIFVAGAPAAVNADFPATLPALRPFFVRCGDDIVPVVPPIATSFGRPIALLDIDASCQTASTRLLSPAGETLSVVPGIGAAWTRDGAALVWLGFADNELYITRLDGQTRRLTHIAEQESPVWDVDSIFPSPAWSPDGQKVALLTHGAAAGVPGDGYAVGVLDVAQGQWLSFAPVPEGIIIGDATSPSFNFVWSPDGRRILLSWQGTWVLDLQSGEGTVLVSQPDAWQGRPVAEWAPRGDAVYYLDVVIPPPPRRARTAVSGLYRWDAGTKRSELVASPEDLRAANWDVDDFYAQMVLSPTGQQMAVLATRVPVGGQRSVEIRTYGVGNGALPRIEQSIRTYPLADAVDMVWAPDETKLLVVARPWAKILLLDLGTGVASKIAEVPLNDVGCIDAWGWMKHLSWAR